MTILRKNDISMIDMAPHFLFNSSMTSCVCEHVLLTLNTIFSFSYIMVRITAPYIVDRHFVTADLLRKTNVRVYRFVPFICLCFSLP